MPSSTLTKYPKTTLHTLLQPEDEVYEVIDQDRYDDYDGDFDLDMLD